MGYIYKITNQVNGKMYIGKTEQSDPYKRWKEHTKQYVLRKHEKRPLYNAMNKYGIDNFNFEILEETENGDNLCNREKYYIDKYRTYVGFKDCNGYNLTLGGDGKSYIKLDNKEVIDYYNNCGKNLRNTARHYSVSHDTIEKILDDNNIERTSSYSSDEYYIYKYGGIVMMDYNGYSIIDILNSPQQFYDKYNFNINGIKKALRREGSYKSGHAQHYLWYRLSELPEEYKPLLDKYNEIYSNIKIQD